MIQLGLSAAERTALLLALRHNQRIRTRVKLLNLEGEHLDDLSTRLADGQVTVDNTQSPTRTASITLDDPHRWLPFDTDSPARTALFLDRMLRVLWEVYVGDPINDFVSVPIFTGPVTGLERDGDQVIASCSGMETLAMGACWHPLHLDRHMKKTDAIRRILAERAGETRFDIPDLDARLPHARSLHRQAVPWNYARRIAASMDRQLFYDGDGICRLRHHPQQARFSFTGQAHVTTAIQVAYSANTVNAVHVLGATPKGSKTQISRSAVAPASHVLSPQRLGRNDVPRFIAKFITDDNLKTGAEAQARADRVLHDGLAQAITVSFSSTPIPLLDPGDMCHVDTEDGDVTFRLQQFSFPLLVGQGGTGSEGTAMTVGVKRRVTRHHPRHQGHKIHRRLAAKHHG